MLILRTALVLALALVAGPAGLALAQNVQRIAAIVNDEVVSGYDVEQRISLVIATTNLQDGPEVRRRLRNQVLRTLVDERLQIQEANRFSIRATDGELKQALAYIAKKNNLPPDQVKTYLVQLGVPPEALDMQLQAEIAWSKLVRRRLAPNVRIGDDEIDEVLERLRNSAGQPEFRISEIFLPVDSPEQDAQVRQEALRLRSQIRSGASFSAMARQFSSGSTAARDGAVGWLQSGQMSREFAAALQGLEPGEVSEPVRAAGGYYLLQLHDRRMVLGNDPLQIKVTLKRLMLPLAPEAGPADIELQRNLALTVRDSVTGCDQVEPVAKELAVDQFGDLGELKLGDMPANIRTAVAKLEIGRFSEPLKIGDGFLLLMVCARDEPKTTLPTREQIEQKLLRDRVTILAQRYLRDLRRDAVVELR